MDFDKFNIELLKSTIAPNSLNIGDIFYYMNSARSIRDSELRVDVINLIYKWSLKTADILLYIDSFMRASYMAIKSRRFTFYEENFVYVSHEGSGSLLSIHMNVYKPSDELSQEDINQQLKRIPHNCILYEHVVKNLDILKSIRYGNYKIT